MKRAATIGDAWHPNVQPVDEFSKLVSQFRTDFPDAKDKRICARIALNVKAEKSEYRSPQGMRRVMLSGNMTENKRMIDSLEQLGISYLVMALSPDGKATVTSQVEGLKMIAKDFL